MGGGTALRPLVSDCFLDSFCYGKCSGSVAGRSAGSSEVTHQPPVGKPSEIFAKPPLPAAPISAICLSLDGDSLNLKVSAAQQVTHSDECPRRVVAVKEALVRCVERLVQAEICAINSH